MNGAHLPGSRPCHRCSPSSSQGTWHAHPIILPCPSLHPCWLRKSQAAPGPSVSGQPRFPRLPSCEGGCSGPALPHGPGAGGTPREPPDSDGHGPGRTGHGPSPCPCHSRHWPLPTLPCRMPPHHLGAVTWPVGRGQAPESRLSTAEGDMLLGAEPEPQETGRWEGPHP